MMILYGEDVEILKSRRIYKILFCNSITQIFQKIKVNKLLFCNKCKTTRILFFSPIICANLVFHTLMIVNFISCGV